MSTFQDIESHISSFGFTYERKDFERPWGGFLVIEEHQAQQFSDQFFSGLDVNTLKISGKLGPKILINLKRACPGSTTTAVQKSGVFIKAAWGSSVPMMTFKVKWKFITKGIKSS